MASFTVFFCGTGSTSFDFNAHNSKNYKDGELISTLASHHMGHEFVDWIIVDGPGSGNLQEAEKWVPSGNYSWLRGTLTGKGWDENVQHAVAVLMGTKFVERKEHTREEERRLRAAGVGVRTEEREGRVARALFGETKTVHDPLHARISPQALQQKKVEIFGKKRPIHCINAVGWSRGGVTCHMFANALAQLPDWSRIPVNIFAADPVPGIGNFQTRRTVLGSNVKDYVAIYATDERSLGFSPVLPQLHASTRRNITTMPGRHGTLVGNAAIDGEDGISTFFAPGKVTRDQAEKWLTSWGTPLDKKLNLTDVQTLALYEEMLSQMPAMREMRKESYTKIALSHRSVGWGPTVSIDLGHPLMLPQDPVFVNSHHRWLFHQHHGLLYRKIFEEYGPFRSWTRMAPLRGLYPHLYARLAKFIEVQGRKVDD